MAALARRVREEKLTVEAVCATDAVEVATRELGIPVIPFANVERLDLLIDGADEVDQRLNMLKGQHGAIGRQRMLAQAAERRIFLVNEGKIVPRLGTHATLPIAVMRWGAASIRAGLRNMGLSGVLRRNLDGELYLTPSGNLILDVMLGERDLKALAAGLDAVAGVIDHGLFLDEADEVLVESRNGEIRRMLRED